MKKISYRLLSVLLAVLLLAGVFSAAPLPVYAEESDPFHATGTCGYPDEADVKYYLFDDGSIAFFGTGDMMNFSAPDAMTPAGPWYLTNPIESLLGSKIAIEDGITSVGDYAFYLPTFYTMILQTYNIDLPNTLTKIGVSAFENQNKIEKISIPKNVTSVGARAFYGCTALAHVDYYGDPQNISWGENVFSKNVTVHIKPEYADQLSTLNSDYNNKNMVFEANLHAENLIEDGIERNIKAYFGQESSKIFCGALPFVVVGTFSGSKKSVTRASNGFVSCVKIGNDYYVHTNNNSRNLNKATLNGITGRVESLAADAHSSLKLRISYDYIGTNIVRMKYELQNMGSETISGIQLGGTGDIKIGADDTAKIEPLYDSDDSSNQIGFYMKSTKEYDIEGGNAATLGFIGKNVSINNNNDTKSPDATFFYGKADASKTDSDVGAYQLKLIPERIFTKGKTAQETGSFPNGETKIDSGMSYYWDINSIEPSETKKFAVLFSVYGSGSSETGGQEMVSNVSANYCTVTWKDGNNNVLHSQIIKEGDTPVYTGDTPKKSPDGAKAYKFNGTWIDGSNTELTSETKITSDTVFTAQFNPVENPDRLFKGHALTLGGDIGVLFYLDKTEVEKSGTGGSTAVVHFKWTVKGEEKTSDSYFTVGDTTNIVTRKVNGEDTEFYVAKCNVPAAEMSYSIRATAVFNGTEHWDVDNYSVREYGLEIIKSEPGTFGTKHTELVTLAKQMLNYGAKAQIAFDRQEVVLANAGVNYTDEQYSMALVKDTDFDTAIASETKNIKNDVNKRSRMREGNSDFGLNYYTSTVVFLSKTSLRHYYTVANENNHKKTYKANDSDNKNLVTKDVFLYAEFTDIPAAELDVLQKLTIGGHDYWFSVLDYAKAMFVSGTEADRNLGAATYLYNKAANEYFPAAQGG